MKQIDQSVVEAFDVMWGLYPEPVLLIHACREILAVNDCAADLGITTGIKCHSMYPSETPCPGCKANAMLKTGKPMRKGALNEQSGKFLDGYWIPVRGVSDIYVHLGNDISEFVKPELLEK